MNELKPIIEERLRELDQELDEYHPSGQYFEGLTSYFAGLQAAYRRTLMNIEKLERKGV